MEHTYIHGWGPYEGEEYEGKCLSYWDDHSPKCQHDLCRVERARNSASRFLLLAQAQDAYAAVVRIARIRRVGIDEKFLPDLRMVELRVTEVLPRVLNACLDFVNTTNLPAIAAKALAREDGAIEELFEERDDLELAISLLRDYIDQEEPLNYTVVADLRKIADMVDEAILFDAELVEQLREIGACESAKYHDGDFFWWLPGERDECYLPKLAREDYLARMVYGTLGNGLTWFIEHVRDCAWCQENYRTVSAASCINAE